MKMFKVVRVDGNGIYSSINSTKYSVNYKLRETTYPELGKLFVFKEYNEALKFLSHLAAFTNNHYAILEGEAKNPRLIKFCAYTLLSRSSAFIPQNSKNINCYWNLKNKHQRLCGDISIAETFFISYTCSEFTPTKIVYVD